MRGNVRLIVRWEMSWMYSKDEIQTTPVVINN